MLVANQEKSIPLSFEQRVDLVKPLLNSRIKNFDFNILGHPEYSREYCNEFRSEEDIKLAIHWDQVFDDLWTDLSAKCPNLESIRELRYTDFIKQHRLRQQIFNFKSLICLETSAILDTGIYTNFKYLVNFV